MKWLNKKGFTLLELLVVVLIIGILAAIAMPQYKKVVEKSRLAESLTTLSALQKAIDIYILTNGYPTTVPGIYLLNSNSDQILDIDIMQGLTCTDNGRGEGCMNKYFSYEAYCNRNGCSISACRFSKNAPNQICYDSNYEINISKRKEDDFWEKTCYWGYDTEYICKFLESQGFERECC